jgi:hypothetical protein
LVNRQKKNTCKAFIELFQRDKLSCEVKQEKWKKKLQNAEEMVALTRL